MTTKKLDSQKTERIQNGTNNLPLFKPEDGGEGATEEDSLDTGECNNSLRERSIRVHPSESPVCLLLYTGQSLDSVE